MSELFRANNYRVYVETIPPSGPPIFFTVKAWSAEDAIVQIQLKSGIRDGWSPLQRVVGVEPDET